MFRYEVTVNKSLNCETVWNLRSIFNSLAHTEVLKETVRLRTRGPKPAASWKDEDSLWTGGTWALSGSQPG